MDRLWAPWRLAYVTAAPAPSTDCIFCDAFKSADAELTVFRGPHAFVILNLYPYNNGHLLVAPYRHVADIEKLTDAESLELMRLTGKAKLALDRAMKPHGYNVGVNLGRAAGAGLPGHVHLHVVPRWNGDTNFMPLLGDTKVLPLTLAESWEMLEKHLR